MPYINIKVSAQESKKLREEIVEFVLNKTSTILKKDKKVTSILVEFVENKSWFIENKNENTFYLNIKITKGTNTKNEKALYMEEIYKEFKKLLGEISKASYILIDEIDADSWGFEGLSQEYRYIKNKA